MAASSMLCSWLMAACMSVAYQKDSSSSILSPTKSSDSSRLLSKWAVRRCIRALVKCVSSCLTFEPCHRFYESNASSELLFGFRSRNSLPHRRCRNLRSGVTKAIAVQQALEGTQNKKLPTKQRRVVVTGMGVETPLGHDPEVFYNNLLEGVSGISGIEGFDCSQYPTRIAGEIKPFSTDGLVAPKLPKRMDKFMLYADCRKEGFT